MTHRLTILFVMLWPVLRGQNTMTPEQASEKIKPKTQATALYTFKTIDPSVQTYVCRGDGSTYAWSKPPFPDAILTDDARTRFIHHYGGPTWEVINGDGKLTGDLSQAVNASVDDSAVDWLLIPVKSASGLFADVKFIQRTATSGGKARSTDACDAAHAGAVVRIPYQATYKLLGNPK